MNLARDSPHSLQIVWTDSVYVLLSSIDAYEKKVKNYLFTIPRKQLENLYRDYIKMNRDKSGTQTCYIHQQNSEHKLYISVIICQSWYQ